MPGPETDFTPLASLAGGLLIGLAAVALWLALGRIAGISGIALAATRPGPEAGRGWRIAFIAGLVAAPAVHAALAGGWPAQTVGTTLPAMALAGLLVGLGSALGSGCTSGHGVCGLGRLSARSLAAVATFMATAAATVFVLRHVAGGWA